ncbi:MAG TPA: hypothetical protein VM925_05800 [Labilithrix sp.]|nr:hypothetical protein [Labilithrix sp.]
MAERTSTPPAAVPSLAPSSHRSRWRFLLPLVWLALGARIVVALVRGESIREDFISLALVAFLMTSAVLGSRIWLWLHDHWEQLTLGKRGQLRHHET